MVNIINTRKKTNFFNLTEGTIFLYDDEVCIVFYNIDRFEKQAVGLETGNVYTMLDYEQVEPIDIDIVIKGGIRLDN